jgi:predicted secreted hydrolase
MNKLLFLIFSLLILLAPTGLFSSAKEHNIKSKSAEFSVAKPNYQFSFPKDHFAHDNYALEWWYYTGNLKSRQANREFGYELTFFKISFKPLAKPIYIAHFALSDLKNNEFKHFSKINRDLLHMAGVEAKKNLIWNKNWSVHIKNNGKNHILKAESGDIALNLNLENSQTPVIHGVPGENINRKGNCSSCASHYYSLTNLKTEGQITINSEVYNVIGKSWMDHEFGSNQLQNNQVGWDWFSLQFNDGSALMLYQLREKNNKISSFSNGTYISREGKIKHLTQKDFFLKPKNNANWQSPKTKANYPLIWEIIVPEFDLALKIIPKMINQEVVEQVNYWEGAISVIDRLKGKKVGYGYLELTGYDGNLDKIGI